MKYWRRDELTFNKLVFRTWRRFCHRDRFNIRRALVKMIVRYTLDILSERPMPEVYEFLCAYRRIETPVDPRAWSEISRRLKSIYRKHPEDLLRLDYEVRRLIADAAPELSVNELAALEELKRDALERRSHHAVTAVNKLLRSARSRHLVARYGDGTTSGGAAPPSGQGFVR